MHMNAAVLKSIFQSVDASVIAGVAGVTAMMQQAPLLWVEGGMNI